MSSTRTSNDDLVVHVDTVENDDAALTPLQIEKKSNKFVYHAVQTSAYASFALEALYEWFTYNYTREAIITLGGFVGVDAASFAAIPAGLLTALDTGANLTLFDPEDEAKMWSEALPDGFFRGTIDYLRKKFTMRATDQQGEVNGRVPGPVNGVFTFLLPATGMLISYPIGAYADVEPIKAWLKEHAGAYHWIPVGGALFIGTCYYVLSQAGDAISGMDFYFNQGKRRLDPPQTTLLHKFAHEKQFASATQCAIETFSSSASRAMSFAFLAGRMFEQENAAEATISIAQAVGFIAATLAFHPARGPKSYEKYFGNANNRLDLVTAEQRKEAYNELYKSSSWIKYIGRELKRALNPIGFSETALSAYAGCMIGCLLNNYIDYSAIESNNPDNMENAKDVNQFDASFVVKHLLPALLAIIAGSAMYFGIYRRANLTRELNQHVVNKQKQDAAQPVVRQEEQPAQPQKQEPGVFAKAVGSMFSAGTWTARTLTSIPTTMGLRGVNRLPVKEQMMLATATSIVPAANGYDYYKDKCTEVVQGYATSASNLFKRCRRPGTVEERQPLIINNGGDNKPSI